MGKTVSIDEQTYKELVTLTANLMLKSEEVLPVGSMVKLAIAYLKSSIEHFPKLEKAIIELIIHEETRFTPIDEITSRWFDKDFLEVTLGIKKA